MRAIVAWKRIVIALVLVSAILCTAASCKVWSKDVYSALGSEATVTVCGVTDEPVSQPAQEHGILDPWWIALMVVTLLAVVVILALIIYFNRKY